MRWYQRRAGGRQQPIRLRGQTRLLRSPDDEAPRPEFRSETMIWNEVPDRSVVAGATVIIVSGLFVVYREIGSVISNRYLRVFTSSSAAALWRRRSRQKQV